MTDRSSALVLGWLVAAACTTTDPNAGSSDDTAGDSSGSTGPSSSASATASSTAATATSASASTAADSTGSDDDDGSSSSGGHTVLPCEGLDAAAGWEHITPGEVDLGAEFDTPAGENYGVHSFVIDPQNTATIYLGTSAQGIYKSTDCGASWEHIDTGTNADVIDGGRQWSFVIDPVDPQVMYTNTGYGANGVWKSTNGGVDWEPFVDPAYLAAMQFGGFVQYVRMDASDHEHLIVTPHFECEIGAVDGLPLTKNCILETFDAGQTWDILEGTPPAGEGVFQTMLDANTWYWSSGFDGMWRTADGGQSWAHVFDEGYANASLVRAADGSLLAGGVFSTLISADGVTWSAIPDSPGTDVLAGDDELLFGSRNGFYVTASADDPTTWSELPMPAFPDPGYITTWDLKYDADHRVLYSLNSRNGFWRLLVP